MQQTESGEAINGNPTASISHFQSLTEQAEADWLLYTTAQILSAPIAANSIRYHYFALKKYLRVWLHFYIVFWNKTILAIKLSLVPILITFFIQNLKVDHTQQK